MKVNKLEIAAAWRTYGPDGEPTDPFVSSCACPQCEGLPGLRYDITYIRTDNVTCTVGVCSDCVLALLA